MKKPPINLQLTGSGLNSTQGEGVISMTIRTINTTKWSTLNVSQAITYLQPKLLPASTKHPIDE
jgi:hypothetical protein